MNFKNKYDMIFSKRTAIYLAVIGVVLFGVSTFSSRQQDSQSIDFSYETFLESRLEKIIMDAGIQDVSVMITTKAKNTNMSKQESLFTGTQEKETRSSRMKNPSTRLSAVSHNSEPQTAPG